jgi:hypothetical protein
MALTDVNTLRRTATLSTELDRLVDLARALERSDNQVQEIGAQLTGPYPVRGEDPTTDPGGGDIQRLQILVDRITDRQMRLSESIQHVREALFGQDPKEATTASQQFNGGALGPKGTF